MGLERAASFVARLAGQWTSIVGQGRIAHRWGSLTSVDLSGFTRLAERFAQGDSGGAEDLNAAINAQFEPLIEVASMFGGDVLQFGGDALLIWYEGPSHEQRAAKSAWLMQQQLAATGRVETAMGPVRLRMSVGIATGQVTFALIGTTHRELLVLGPTATATVSLEGRAAAGQILVNAATAAALPTGAVSDEGDAAWRLRRNVDALPATLATVDPVVALQFVPPQVRPIVQADVVTAEHRRVTVAFVKIPGTDALAGPQGEPLLARMLDVVERAADRAVVDFDVCWSATDIAPDGFKLLFFAGAPVALEDDAGRLLRSALLIADECSTFGVRIGISTGLAFAAEVGHPDRRTFAIIGDTVNLAARLTSAASTERPLASTATVRASRSIWRTGADVTMTVKGKRLAITAHEVLAEGTDVGQGESLPELVGREDQLATLIDGALDRVGSSFEIVGEAGIGKTILIRHLATLAAGRGLRSFVASATPVRARTAHGVLGDVFPQLTAGEGGDLMSTDDLVARRDRKHADLIDGVRASGEPTLLVVEDSQWLDDASRSLLLQLLAAIDDLPWSVVITRRPDALPLPTGHTMRLAGLSVDQLLQIATPDDGSGWLDGDIERLAASVEGNPMYFSEALRLPRGTSQAIASGRSVELLAERLDQLSPTARRPVRALAVAGRPLSFELLATAAGQDLDHLPAGWSKGVLTERHDGWWFEHEPTVAIARAGLARRVRRQVHANTAMLLEALRDELSVTAAELALHHAGAGHAAAAWTWSRRAAGEARSAGALREAAELLDLAIDVVEVADDPAEVERSALDLADLDIALGRFDRADMLLRDVWQRCGMEPPVRALLGRARAAEQAGRLVAAGRFIRRAIADSRCDDAESIDATLLAASILHRQGRPRAAIAGCWRALIGAKRLNDDRRRAQAHLQLEMVRWTSGHHHAARHEACAEALFRRVGDARGLGLLLMNRGVNRLNQGPWNAALADCDEATRVLDAAGYLIDGAIASMNGAVVLVRQGRTGDALTRARQIERTFRGLGWAEGVAYLDLPMAAAHGQRGQIDEALERLQQSEQVFVQTHNLEFLGETRRQRALCLLYARRTDAALVELAAIERAWFELDPVLEVGAAWLSGHAALQHRDLARADDLLHAAAAVAEQRQLPFDLARVAWSLESWAELVGSDEAAAWRGRRLEIFRSLEVTADLPPLPI